MKHAARAKNVFNQSAHLFILSTTNQNMQKTIESEEKVTFHTGRKQRSNHRPFTVEKNSSHKKSVLELVFRFSREIFTLSDSRYIF